MTARRCAALAELRSAYVDGALRDADRERLLRHLVDCPACRADIAELRAVRAMLSRRAEPVGAPGELNRRLVSIGHPDRAPAASAGRRRVVPARAAVAGLAAGALVTLVGAVGWAASPGAELVPVPDPVGAAQAAYAAGLGQVPLANGAVGAVALSGAPGTAVDTAVSGGPTTALSRSLNTAEARAAMQRAADVAGAVGYYGRQSFRASRGGAVLAAELEVDAPVGQSRQVRVLSLGGEQLLTGSAPGELPSRLTDGDLIGLLEHNYELTGRTGAVVAGRAATMVTASRAGRVVARWWLDDQTGLLLWQQTYDESGSIAVSFGFTTLVVADRARIAEHLPPLLAVPTTPVTMSPADAGSLSSSGWFCRAHLAGLSLVRLSADRTEQPSRLHLVFSDGVNTASVVEQRGRLAGPPRGTTLDPTLGVYVRTGASNIATWQSGENVYTVVTDQTPAQLAELVRALPHDPPLGATTMGDVKAGWAKILADLKG